MAFLPPIEPFGQQHSHSIRGYSAVAYQQPFLSYSETHIASIPIFSVVGSLFPVPFALMQRKHNGCGSNDDFVFFFLGLSARKGTTGISNDGNHLPMYPVLSRICLLHTPVYHRIRANKVFHAEIPVRSIYRIRHPVLDIDRNRNHAFLRIVCIEDMSDLKAHDDVAECFWLRREEIEPEKFAFQSIRKAVDRLLKDDKYWVKD